MTLTLPHIPALRRGRTYESLDTAAVADYRTGVPQAAVSQVNAGIIRKDLPRFSRIPRRAEKIFRDATDRNLRPGRRTFPRRHAPARRRGRNPVAAAIHRDPFRHERFAPGHGAAQHGENSRRPCQYENHSQRTDPRPGSGRFGRRGEPAIRHPPQFLRGRPMPGRGHAEQFPGRQFPLAARHSAQNSGRHQTGPRGTVDALPPHPGLYRGGLSGGGVWLLSHRSRGRRRNSARLRTRRWFSAARAPRPPTPAIPPFKFTGRATAKSSSARTKSSAGRSSLISMVSRISDNGGRSCINASAVVVPRHAAEIARALAEKLGPIVAPACHRRAGPAGRLCQSENGRARLTPALKKV